MHHHTHNKNNESPYITNFSVTNNTTELTDNYTKKHSLNKNKPLKATGQTNYNSSPLTKRKYIDEYDEFCGNFLNDKENLFRSFDILSDDIKLSSNNDDNEDKFKNCQKLFEMDKSNNSLLNTLEVGRPKRSPSKEYGNKTTRHSTTKPPSDEIVVNIFGNPETGKTSFVLSYCGNKFNVFYIPSIGEEITRKNAYLNGKSRHFKFIVNNFSNITEITGFVFVFFDLTNLKSFQDACKFIDNNKFSRNLFLIANKCDCQKTYSMELINEFVKKTSCYYHEISVKNQLGISLLMSKLINLSDQMKEKTL